MNSTHAVKIYSKADDDDDGNNGDNKPMITVSTCVTPISASSPRRLAR